MKPKVACVGFRGYAQSYIKPALKMKQEGVIDFVGVVQRNAEKSPERVEQLTAAGVPIYPDTTTLYKEVPDLDMVVIGTGLSSHCWMTCEALGKRVHVFLAKPAAVLIQDIDQMSEAARKADRMLAVDFQHIYSIAAQDIKERIHNGQLGEIKEIVAKLYWPRPESYYARNDWAGRIKIGDDFVLDGPINNPHAHYIMNAYYFSSAERHGFVKPTSVRAELYKANPIEGEDTACLSVTTDAGVPFYMYSTLASEAQANETKVEIHGTKGVAVWGKANYAIQAEGIEPVDLKSPRAQSEDPFRYILKCLETGERPLVTIDDCRNHVLTTNGAYESAGRIVPIPADHLGRSTDKKGEEYIEIKGINDLIEKAGDARKMFSEMNVPWVVPTKAFELDGYKKFDMDLK
jgi:predicted dehydrogenase